ncbi:MAG: hypothetical protein KDC93_14390 [Cyclobacteriaceae bacterium]|nr:hypothetical protein [Cyclobacteriaceae bacterium]
MSKFTFFLLFFTSCLGSVLAQSEQDATASNKVSVAAMDSLTTNQAEKIDSINSATLGKLDTLNTLTSKVNQLQDSLNTAFHNNKIDSVRGKLTHRIDSLNQLQLPTKKYTRLLDSLNQIPNNPVNNANEKVVAVQSKVNAIQGKVNSPANKVERGVNEKLNLMKSEGGDGANLPGNVNLPGVDAPGVPGVDGSLPSTDLDIDQSGIPRLDGAGGAGIPDLKGELPVLDELNGVQEQFGKVGEATNQIGGYSEDLKNISSGNLGEVEQVPEKLESEAVKIGDAGMLSEKSQELDGYKEMIASGGDKEAMKQQALQQAPKLAKNHFKGQEAALQQAINKVNSYKKKYTELSDLENIPKRKPNAMKDKPFIERLVPGMTFQIQKSENVWLDYNPSLSYLISGRFVAGLGWNERIGITNHFGFTSTDHIYGPRTFLEVKIKKGFSLRVEAEKMYTFVPPNIFSPTDLGGNRWVGSAFIGMKKQYDFMKSIKGNFQFLYNFYDDHDNSPYTSRFNVRFGFEFPMKKKVKQKSGANENIQPNR